MDNITTYLLLAISIALLLLTEAWADARKSRHLNDVYSRKGDPAIVNRKHIAGILIFLISFLYYLSINSYDTAFFDLGWSTNGVFIILFLLLAACKVGTNSADSNANKYLAVSLDNSTLFRYLSIRIVFLVLYEFFFRGVLLQLFINEAGVIIAIMVNILLYALAHYYSERKEIIGTVPFGLLLCMISIYYQSIWPAILLHLALAMSYELRLITKKRPPIKSWRL
ncbi:MAG TPA: type II CAAX endopeptidase family protein [Chitinophagaceae bacterium]